MTSLSEALGWNKLIAWRLDPLQFAPTWDSGEGAFRFGGRWNRPGLRAVYSSRDPATAILEVAVHKGFEALDRVPHVLTGFRVTDPSQVHVLPAKALPDLKWLSSGLPSVTQQDYGNLLLDNHPFVLLPSVVSRHSWNLVFTASAAQGRYDVISQETFMLDTRLHPQQKL